MNRKDIIRMAQKVGLDSDKIDDKQGVLWLITMNDLERFATLIEQHLIASGYRRCAEGQRVTQYCCMVEEAVKEEREACARVCEHDVGMLGKGEAGEFWTYMCAKAIRARGKA